MALFLFTKPLKGKINELQSDFLDTAFHEELNHQGTPIMTYRWLGNKKTVLLVHGWESNSARWRAIIPELQAKGHTVVALDAPAHGRSGSRRFNALLYAEFINEATKRFHPEIIVGHSVGGMASVYYLHKYQPPSVKKVVLLGAPSEFSDIISRYFLMMGYNKKTINAIKKRIKDKYGIEVDDFSSVKHLKTILSEGLIIHDKTDPIIPYEDAVLINSNFKNSTLITTEGFGHSLYDESVSNHIYHFIES
ncbi:alpha/beta fold hydrolase [Mangrovimonas sp. ST2L15]|uniref:alpha/beta fold hydrolase n=1 Tax=Mangrovimonas sp. ST2L15 TaxID=1645916 RepID=UPI000B0180D1|nr:alpha/beta fold hydrolase [Mangrovimonas sp. ST2L15]